MILLLLIPLNLAHPLFRESPLKKYKHVILSEAKNLAIHCKFRFFTSLRSGQNEKTSFLGIHS